MSLSPKIRLWEKLMAEMEVMSGQQLKKEILKNVDFIIKNYGFNPKEYYECTNKKLKEINKKVENLRHMHAIMFDEKNEEMIKKLYKACAGNKKSTSDEAYKKFYLDLWDSMAMWYYGDDFQVTIQRSSFSPYTRLKAKLANIMLMLETGKVIEMEEKYNKYYKAIKYKPESAQYG